MIDVTVKVPDDRVAEFYSMFGAWLSSPPDESSTSGSADHLHWSSDDVELAATVWGKFSNVAKALFSVLIDNPEVKFSGEDLAGKLGLAKGKHGVAGVLAWPGRHCFAVNRVLPWSWEYPVENEPAVYWFTTEMADLFRRARAC